ncbi:MAG: YkgJ family cysteine cluster protein [Clostridia bacterium]|uniref:YkgJ family cysteine cluster protein n=1 Tax=Clostridium sp. TaxID=1506 RepID=UPI002FCA4F45
MGRNDLCFCGSGKKKKKCHNDIHETSEFSEVIKLYKTIDEKIKNETDFNKIKCHKGCSECCSQYFPVTTVEVYYIVDKILETYGEYKLDEYIEKAKIRFEELNTNHPQKAKELTINMSGNKSRDGLYNIMMNSVSNHNIESKCIFLDKEGTCEVYPFRPMVCRTHGVGAPMESLDSLIDQKPNHTIEVCSKINYSSTSEMSHLADLSEQMNDYSNLYTFYIKDSATIATERMFPIFYFFSKFYGKKDILFEKVKQYKILDKDFLMANKASKIRKRG